MHGLPAILRWFLYCALLLGSLWHTLANADAVSLHETPGNRALGVHAAYFAESGQTLSLEEAIAARTSGKFSPSNTDVLSFGIGARPVWVHLPVINQSDAAALRRFQIENAWQDHIDLYFISPDGSRQHQPFGDNRPFAERILKSRFFAAEHRFAPGTTDIYLRVSGADPIVLPIFLSQPENVDKRELTQGYRYGFIYGYLLALMGYNLLLYLSLRDKRHLSYAIYIALFVVTNLAYTGHGFAYLWQENVALQRWIIPVLMVFFSLSGLLFARHFLDTPKNFPRSHRAMVWSSSAFLAALAAACLLSDDQALAILVAFVCVNVYSIALPALGLLALYARHRFSRYFLTATLASTLGTAVTSLAVLGFISFSDLRFRAVEIGMVIDATLLALALGSQFRTMQAERLFAERLAARDSLTDLYNRRSFLELARPLWSNAKRHERNLSLIMVDIDHFKSINDSHGHAAGDNAIIALTRVLVETVRAGDVVARWGGEEFLVLLPETPLAAAVLLAERLRQRIEEVRVPMGGADIGFTVSLGVASSDGKESLDRLITEADHFLYESKHQGRNRVSAELAVAST